MLIRRAVVADALQVADVHVRSWRAGYRGMLPQDLLDGLDPQQRVPRWEAAIEQSNCPTRCTVVAEEAGRLVGFARLCPTRDDDRTQHPSARSRLSTFHPMCGVRASVGH